MSGNADDGRWEKPLRSKGVLPALGVGGIVYLVTGAVSMGTLAMVGIGAGVGYGVGSWLSDQYEKKKSQDGGSVTDPAQRGAVPDALQVSLMQWQVFLNSRAPGAELQKEQLEQLFAEFAQLEPQHAQNVQAVQSMIHSRSVNTAGSSSSIGGGGGPTIVPNMAAEV